VETGNPAHNRTGRYAAVPGTPRRGFFAQLDRNHAKCRDDNRAAQNLYKRRGFTVERAFSGQFNGCACPVTKLRYEKAP